MCLQIGGVNYHRAFFAVLGRQTSHHQREDAPITRPLPAVAERLVRVVLRRRVAPAQPIAVDEDNPAQHTPIIDARLAVGLREIGLKTQHLRVRQPDEIRHVHRSFSEP